MSSSPITYVPLPSPGHPRLLVPTVRRAAVAALATRTDGAGRSERVARAGFGTLARLGLLRWGVPDARWDRLHAHLSARLDAEVALAIRVGAPRPNRKPVVQILSPDGVTLAWAKIGHDPATRAAIRHEAYVLRKLDGGRQGMITPRVVDLDVVDDLQVLVTTPLRTKGSMGTTLPIPVAVAISRIHPWRLRPLEESTPVRHARHALALAPDPEPRLAGLLARIEAWSDDLVLLGGGHGDLSPTNLTAFAADRAAVWDWERASDRVPVGMDALHHALQASRRTRRSPAQRLRLTLQQTHDFAQAASLRPDHAPLLLTLELLEMQARLADARRQGRRCDDGFFGPLTDALLERDGHEGSDAWS